VHQTVKWFLFLGSLLAFLAVALGAFGAHALKDKLSVEMTAIWHTSVQYHMYHALGLLAVGLIALHMPPSPWITWAGVFLLTGIALFSGSLYLLALTEVRWLGMITPFGGTAFLVAWLLLAVGVWRGIS
jgi:uncharacterized membrane protein YgdD (TMEM256/DUF423 family)